MKKNLTLIALLLVCSLGYADSLHRVINIYKEKDGAKCMVFNRDSHFNDVPESALSPFSMKLRSGTLKAVGIEEMIVLQLDRCDESVRDCFVDEVHDAVPVDYSMLADSEGAQVYMSNSDEEYAYVLLVNNRTPKLTLMYVTNSFVRAMVSDDGSELDSDKLNEYLEQQAEKLGETIRVTGEKVMEHLNRFKERVEEWEDSGVWL